MRLVKCFGIEKRKSGIPVETVDIEDFGNPHQGCNIIEPIVYEQEEPKVNGNSSFSMTWYLVSF